MLVNNCFVDIDGALRRVRVMLMLRMLALCVRDEAGSGACFVCKREAVYRIVPYCTIDKAACLIGVC